MTSKNSITTSEVAVEPMMAKDSILVVVAYNCNHDHTKFSHMIPLTVTFRNLETCNLPDFSQHCLLKIENFIGRNILQASELGQIDFTKFFMHFASDGSVIE